MSSMIEHVKEAGDAPKLQVLFKEFKKKLADFTGKAIEAQKESVAVLQAVAEFVGTEKALHWVPMLTVIFLPIYNGQVRLD
ncbi:hypothetical protein WJX79_000288 [Trebouxia sp. C0005]